MSQTIRKYVDYYGKDFFITAYVGPEGQRSAVQFTIIDGGKSAYVNLSEDQVKDLIEILQKRINNEVTATGYNPEEKFIVYFDGEKEHDEDL